MMVKPSTWVPAVISPSSSPKVNHGISVSTGSRRAGASASAPASPPSSAAVADSPAPGAMAPSSPPSSTASAAGSSTWVAGSVWAISGWSRKCTPATIERRNAVPTAAVPICHPPPGRRLPKNSVSQKATKVRAGMIQMRRSTGRPQPLMLETSSRSTELRLR